MRADARSDANLPAVVLFDLDGTLSDSAAGIVASLRHALRANGLPPLDPLTERSVLGPPFAESLPPLIGGADRLPAVVAAYRDHYGREGMYATTAFPGIPELLDGLRAAGVRLAVATSKPEAYAVPIVEHLGLTWCFEAVCGDALDGSRGTKALVVAEAVRRLGRPDPSEVLMVGDREHDVVGAHAHGIACVGAGWGYALAGELAAAGADPICATPVELARTLGVAVDAAAR